MLHREDTILEFNKSKYQKLDEDDDDDDDDPPALMTKSQKVWIYPGYIIIVYR